MPNETTTIEISHENWQWLSSLKQRPGDSFNDVLDRLREQDGQASDLETATAGSEPGEMTADAGEALFGDHDEDHDVKEIEPAGVPDDLDLPGNGETYERRRETIGTLYAYLQEHETATRSDFLELVDPDVVGYASADSFWSNAVKGRDSLSSLEGVVPPSEGGHTWRYEPETQ